MSKFDLMDEMLIKNNGYLFTQEVESAGISRTYMRRYIQEKELEMAARGIYVSADTWADELYVLQIRNPQVIYSGETALYLNHMTDREYSAVYVCVPEGHNGSRLRKRGIFVHQERPELYGLGLCSIETNYGNQVQAYNRERCLCDTVRNRKKLEIQTFQTAVKSYMQSREKDLSLLMKYAEVLKVRDEVMKYVEVMV